MPLENAKETIKIDIPDEEKMKMPGVEELLKILIDVNMAQSQQSVTLLVNYMNEVEENFFEVLQELDAVKEQLHHVQNTPQTQKVRQSLSDMAGQLRGRISSLQEQLHGMRVSLNEKASQLVQDFKEHGVTALNNVCGYLGVKDAMKQLKDSLVQTAGDMQSSMDKIDKVSQELRETTTHARNVGKALAGKETLETPQQKQGGFFHTMKRPYQGLKDFCAGNARKLEQAIVKLEGLEQSAGKIKEKTAGRKPPIAERLQTLKEGQDSREKDTPVADKAKKQEASL